MARLLLVGLLLAAPSAGAATLTGTVTDRNGFPVPEAEVYAGESRSYEGAAGRTARADARGVYTIPDELPAGESVVTVRRAGFAPELVRVTLPAGDAPHELDFVLRPPGLYRVRVVDGEGRPVERALIDVHRWRGARTLPSAFFTDADGLGEWGGPRDDVEAVVTAEGFRLAEATLRPTAPDAAVEVRLEPAIEVAVTVVSAATGEPLPGVSVVQGFQNPGGSFSGADDAVTDKAGVARFFFDHVTPGWAFRVSDERVKEATVPLGEVAEDAQRVELRLEAEPILEATVTLKLDGGGAAAGATAYVVPAGGNLRVRGGEVVSDWLRREPLVADAGGAVSFHPPGGGGVLVATHAGGVGWADLSDTPRELTLRPFARVGGRLLNNGEPVAGQPVGMISHGRGLLGGSTAVGVMADADTTTDAQGRFAFERVWPGTHEAGRWVPFPDGGGGGNVVGSSVEVHTEHGATATADLEESGLPLVGRITNLPARDPDELNPPVVFTFLQRPDAEPGDPLSVQVEPDGRFEVAAVPGGPWVLTAQVIEVFSDVNHGSVEHAFDAPAFTPGAGPIDLGDLPLDPP